LYFIHFQRFVNLQKSPLESASKLAALHETGSKLTDSKRLAIPKLYRFFGYNRYTKSAKKPTERLVDLV
jgi:hypothetical protein